MCRAVAARPPSPVSVSSVSTSTLKVGIAGEDAFRGTRDWCRQFTGLQSIVDKNSESIAGVRP